MTEARMWKLQALTDIWTGDVQGKPERLITTGLLGSIRWWFEVVVRGLGGSACDPTDTQCEGRNHCVACELFGCTGWARKFRFDVLGADGMPQQDKIVAGQYLQFRFVPVRPVRSQEWALIGLTFRLTDKYGAIGGKSIYKPTDESGRASQPHHQDFGLVRLIDPSNADGFSRKDLDAYIHDSRSKSARANVLEWASIQNFWHVEGRNLARAGLRDSSFNRVVGRKEDKAVKDRKGKKVVRWSDLLQDKGDFTKWLAGGRAESKKVFSFKEPENARRTFGFVQSTEQLDQMRQRLREKAWEDLRDEEFMSGHEILKRLLNEGGTQ